jgi:O-antigen/teichoic acid export membrane protein
MRVDIARLARDALTYGSGQVLSRFIGVLLLPIFTRYLTPEDYGISGILGVVTFFVTPLFALGIATAMGLMYFDRDDPTAKEATVWTAFSLLVASAAVLLLVAVILRESLGALLLPGDNRGYDPTYLVLVALSTAALVIVTQPLLVALQLEAKAKTFVAVTLGSSLLTIALSVLLVVGLHRGIQGMLEGSLIAQAATLVAAVPLTLGRTRYRLQAHRARELLRLGIPLVPAFLVMFVMQQVSKIVIQADMGLAAVGTYTVGANLGLFLALPVGGFTTAWFPYFMSYVDRQDEAETLFGRILTYYVLAFGSLSLLFFIAARPAVMILTQERFHQAFVVVGPSAAAQFLLGVHSILLAGMYFAKQVKYQAVIQGAAAGITLALNVVLIATMGIAGAAVALMIGFLSMVVIQYWWNVRRGYLRVRYESRRLAIFAAAYAVYCVVFLWDRGLPLAGELLLSAAGLVALVGLVVRLLNPAERASAISVLVNLRDNLPTANRGGS